MDDFRIETDTIKIETLEVIATTTTHEVFLVLFLLQDLYFLVKTLTIIILKDLFSVNYVLSMDMKLSIMRNFLSLHLNDHMLGLPLA